MLGNAKERGLGLCGVKGLSEVMLKPTEGQSNGGQGQKEIEECKDKFSNHGNSLTTRI